MYLPYAKCDLGKRCVVKYLITDLLSISNLIFVYVSDSNSDSETHFKLCS